MGKYLKLFTNHNEYLAFTHTEGYLLPNVSHCFTEKDVHYNPITTETRLMVTYNVSDASNATQLYFYYVGEGDADPSAFAVNMFDKVEIDGTEVAVADLDADNGTYDFGVGEHTVAYTLKDPTFIGAVLDEGAGTVNLGAVFVECTDIASVEIPDSVTFIGNSVFSDCTGLTSVTIPSSVTSIGNYAFAGCSNLTGVTFESNSQLTDIGGFAFAGCSGLTSITIPSGVTSIGQSAFDSCSGLTSINIPNSVSTIGNFAFCQCSSLDAASRAAINAINANATHCMSDVQN